MFHGSMVALVTPLLESGAVDLTAFCELIEWHIEQGTSAIVVAGTTGESATLRDDEKLELFRVAMKQVRERVPIIAGTGAQSTAHAISLTRDAMSTGVHACLIMTPAYIKPTQEGLYRHYSAIANAVGIPIILYNVPGRTAVDLLPETVSRLSEIGNIVGIKEALDKPERIQALVEGCSERLSVYSGDDFTLLDCIRLGGKGVISVTANVVPGLMSEMLDLALKGDLEGAEKIQQELMPLHESMFLEANPIPVKFALTQMNRIPAGIRLPLTPLSISAQPKVTKELERLGLLTRSSV